MEEPEWLDRVFPDKPKMVRAANVLLAILAIAPVMYIVIPILLGLGGRGFAGNPDFVRFLFPSLVAVSAANVGVMVYLQMRWRPVTGQSQFLLVNRVYVTVSLGAVLSESHSVYGFLLTLLSGSILYVIGFSLAGWVSLLWVRARFKENLAKIPG